MVNVKFVIFTVCMSAAVALTFAASARSLKPFKDANIDNFCGKNVANAFRAFAIVTPIASAIGFLLGIAGIFVGTPLKIPSAIFGILTFLCAIPSWAIVAYYWDRNVTYGGFTTKANGCFPHARPDFLAMYVAGSGTALIGAILLFVLADPAAAATDAGNTDGNKKPAPEAAPEVKVPKADEEGATPQPKEDDSKQKQEEADKKRKEQEQAAAAAADAEKKRKEQEQAAAAAEAEKKRQEQEQAAAADAEKKRHEQEQAAAAAEAEKKRKEQEQAAAAADAEKKRKEQEQAAAAEAEKKRKEQEAAAAAAEAEKKRQEQEQAAAAAAAEAQRKEAEEAEKKRKEQEEAAAAANAAAASANKKPKLNINWKEVNAKLPYDKKNPEQKKLRFEMFDKIDVNKTGKVSLSEVTAGMEAVLQLPEELHVPTVIKTAFDKAKVAGQQAGVNNDDASGGDFIEKNEFRLFLMYTRMYFEMFQLFSALDETGDMLIELAEFQKALPLLKTWGAKIDDAAATFKQIDKNGGGKILFDEFVDWALSPEQNLDCPDDDE